MPFPFRYRFASHGADHKLLIAVSALAALISTFGLSRVMLHSSETAAAVGRDLARPVWVGSLETAATEPVPLGDALTSAAYTTTPALIGSVAIRAPLRDRPCPGDSGCAVAKTSKVALPPRRPRAIEPAVPAVVALAKTHDAPKTGFFQSLPTASSLLRPLNFAGDTLSSLIKKF